MKGCVFSLYLLALLVFPCCAFSNYRYRNGYPSRYTPSRLTYSPYAKTSYYAKASAATVYAAPWCSRGKTLLSVYVVEQEGGKAIEKAKVHYVDSKTKDEVTTAANGMVNIIVCGCSVRFIVYGPQGQAVSKQVDLNAASGKNAKVVIALKDACNFYVFFDNKALANFEFLGPGGNLLGPTPAPDDELAGDIVDEPALFFSDKVTYIYQSGKTTGDGELVANQVSSPLCIYVDTTTGNDNLEMTIISQSGNLFNTLSITDVFDEDFPPFAYITIPLHNPFEADNGETEKFDLHIFFNMMGYNLNFIFEFINNVKLDDVKILKAEDGSDIDDYDFNTLCIRVEENALSTGKTYLIAVQFNAVEKLYFKGNAALIDGTGSSATTEINDEVYEGDDATEFWVLGCLCDGANVKKYKPVNEFMKSADFDVASEVQGICDPRCN